MNYIFKKQLIKSLKVMKKLLLLIVAIAIIAGCSKDEVVDPVSPGDLNASLKDYVMTVDLMAGQHINVGTVTYVDDENGHFIITYTLTGGWTMSESHVYVGLYNNMPLNKPGAPKIGNFPYKETHSPAVTTYTYTVSSEGLPGPDLDNPENHYKDLVFAAHCVVNNPNGGNETGWAAGNDCFDKGWGMYNYFNGATYVGDENSPSFYAIQYNEQGILDLVLINTGTNTADVILSEAIASSGTLSGLAYDPSTSYLYFAIGNQFYALNINDDLPTQYIGSLQGIPIGGTIINGVYYYYDADPDSPNFGEIIQVIITNDGNGGWTMTENGDYSGSMFDDLLGLPNLVVTDITAGADGSIYLISSDYNVSPDNPNGDNVWLVTFDGTSFSAEITYINGDSQIAYGADGDLYVFQTDANGDSILLELDPEETVPPEVPPGNDDELMGDGVGEYVNVTGGDAL
jgi:hypothetical protein